MLSTLQQKAVWEGWLAAEIRANYYADLAGRYQRNQRIVTWATLVFSSGAFFALLSDWLPAKVSWVRPLLAFVTVALSLWSLTARSERKEIDCLDIHFQWNILARDFEGLWDDMHAESSPAKLREMQERSAQLSKISASFPNKRKLMLKWQDHVELQHKAVEGA
jgi:hypothetical protein